jgi:hypothetical protein
MTNFATWIFNVEGVTKTQSATMISTFASAYLGLQQNPIPMGKNFGVSVSVI